MTWRKIWDRFPEHVFFYVRSSSEHVTENQEALCHVSQGTGMANWPNTIQRLGSDDLMSLGIKSSAFLRVEETDAWKFEVRICGF